MTQNNNILISIEGNIGSGKTTFLKHLKKMKSMNNIVFVPEPIHNWIEVKDSGGEDILTKFYQDPKKYAFSFQMLAFFTRHQLISKALEENTNSIIITERSMGTDRNIFAQMLKDDGKIDEVEFQIYMKWFGSLCEDIKADKYIYLYTLPDISFQRILKRNRLGESKIQESYIRNCHAYHNIWLLDKENVKIIDVSADNYKPIEEELKRYITNLS